MSDRHPVMTPLPPLVEGQRLDQPTFHARYEAMPPGTRAELIDGIVFIPPRNTYGHGISVPPFAGWVAYYTEQVPALIATLHTTTILGPKSELEPDLALFIPPELGGQIQSDDQWLRGAPELVVEVADETRDIDLGPKREDYQRAGVREYIVRTLEPDAVYWFVLRDGRFAEMKPGADGIYRSEVFPGLWLDPVALIACDTRRLRAVVDFGCATPAHAAFVARLAAAREQMQQEQSPPA